MPPSLADSFLDRFCLGADPWLLAGTVIAVAPLLVHVAIRRNLPVELKVTPIAVQPFARTQIEALAARPARR